MKQNENEPTGRESTPCRLKPHRLICINPPGSMTGPRTKKRSARAAVVKDEHPGSARPGQEPPLNERRSVSARPAGPGNGVLHIPAGPGSDGTGPAERSVTQGLVRKRKAGNILPEMPVHPQDRQKEMPADPLDQQDPAGGAQGSGVLPAPAGGGGDAG